MQPEQPPHSRASAAVPRVLPSLLLTPSVLARVFVYSYGVMTWRVWMPYHSEADAACGERGDDGPSLEGPSGRLKRLIKARQPGGLCANAVGPYPFADGSLQILSADLMHAFVESPCVDYSGAPACRTVASAAGLCSIAQICQLATCPPPAPLCSLAGSAATSAAATCTESTRLTGRTRTRASLTSSTIRLSYRSCPSRTSSSPLGSTTR